jgi:hypothetical protein
LGFVFCVFSFVFFSQGYALCYGATAPLGLFFLTLDLALFSAFPTFGLWNLALFGA